MSAEIIQFVPRANPNRGAVFCEPIPHPSWTILGDNMAYIHATGQVVTWEMPSDPYVAPADDCV